MRRVLLVLLVVVLILGGGATVVLTAQQRVRAALRRAARRYGLDPDVVDAIGYVESRWTVAARNLTGADGARGGAWGPTQITERTARAAGYVGRIGALAEDVELAAEWTARIMLTRPGGPPRTVEDASAYWNAGRASAAALPAGHVTLTTYIPRARSALALVRSSPLPPEVA